MSIHKSYDPTNVPSQETNQFRPNNYNEDLFDQLNSGRWKQSNNIMIMNVKGSVMHEKTKTTANLKQHSEVATSNGIGAKFINRIYFPGNRKNDEELKLMTDYNLEN